MEHRELLRVHRSENTSGDLRARVRVHGGEFVNLVEKDCDHKWECTGCEHEWKFKSMSESALE
jgi:hypothetical protein